MIYLIGGTARSGKTTLASQILTRSSISSLSTDVLRNVLDFSPTDLGIGMLPEDKRSEAFYPYLYKFLRILQNKYPNYVVEGDIFTPVQVCELQKNIELRCCFLGMSSPSIDSLMDDSQANWIKGLGGEEQQNVLEGIISRSRYFKDEADKYGIPYFDTSHDRDAVLEQAYSLLTN